MLEWLADDLFDYLLLPQDDTAYYGWNIAEARALQMRIRVEGLSDRAITYPGADEIGCLLIASSICRLYNFKPRVWPRYSAVNSPGVITAYEDRPFHELLKAHLAPLGGILVDSPENADLHLFINAPSLAQGEGMYQWLVWRGVDQLKQESPQATGLYLEKVVSDPLYKLTRQEMQTPQRNLEEFVRALLDEIEKGHPVALADVAFVNGADLILGNLLTQHAEIGKLFSYGAWNTAGNTLGMVLAHAVLRLVSLKSGDNRLSTQAHLEFLFHRWLDDYYYQARERTSTMIQDLPGLGIQLSLERIQDSGKFTEIEKRVRLRLQKAGTELSQIFIRSKLVDRVEIRNIYLPWQRLFEVGFDVEVHLS
jgi:hypothetical protein